MWRGFGSLVTAVLLTVCSAHIPGTRRPDPPEPISNPNFRCDFNNLNLCGMDQPFLEQEGHPWLVKNGDTKTKLTGPSTGINNSPYAYIEASGQRTNSLATMDVVIPPEFQDRCYCVSLFHHMYGDDIDTLSVLSVGASGNSRVEWSISGDQGDVWQLSRFSLERRDLSRIRIQASTGRIGQPRGDIAIDNLEIHMGCCGASTLPPHPPVTPTTTPSPGQCKDLQKCIRCMCDVEDLIRPEDLDRDDLDETSIFTENRDDDDDAGRRCGISRTYFWDCRHTGALSMPQPSYERCMADTNCVHECVTAQVTRLASRCTGNENVNHLSCFDVARIHRGQASRCLNVNANFYAFVVNAICEWP